MSIVFYDIASEQPLRTFAPNPWKTRRALNHKGVSYRTESVDMPDITALREKLGVPANRTLPDGTPYHTLPVMQDLSTGEVIGDSFEIALYLDRTYPDHPALFRPSTIGLTAAFNAQVDGIFTKHVGLCNQMPVTETAKAVFVQRTGVGKFEDLRMDDDKRSKLFVEFEAALGELAKAYYHTGGTTDHVWRPSGTDGAQKQRPPPGFKQAGPFLDGDEPVYSDFIVGAWLSMLKASLGPEDWKRISSWQEGLWDRVLIGLEKWSELKSSAVTAQRYDGQFWPCNPLKNATGACRPNDGLPTSTYSVDFTKHTAVPDNWTISNYATVNFGSQGAEFTFNKRWDAPQLWTDFYILFGRVSVVARVANGTGMISSAVLISDAFDEIDFEISGNNFGHSEWSAGKGQNNYFGKGITGDYDRGSYFDVSNPQGSFHTYTFDWTPTELKWLVDGRVVRSHFASDGDRASHQYPQTPSKFQLGIWAGGDPSSNQGTRDWAGGYTDLEGGPYTMWVKSVKIENAMPAWAYNYTNQSGDWKSIALLQQPPPVVSASSGVSSRSLTAVSKPTYSSMASTSKSAALSGLVSTFKSIASVASPSSTIKPLSTIKPSSTVDPSSTTASSKSAAVSRSTNLASAGPSSSGSKPSKAVTTAPSTGATSPISKVSTNILPLTSTRKLSTTISCAGTSKPLNTQSSLSLKPNSINFPSAYGATPTSRSSTTTIQKQPTATAISTVSKATVAKQPTATTVNGVKFVYSYTTSTKCTTTAKPKPTEYKIRAATTSASGWVWNGWSNQWHDGRKQRKGGRHAHNHG